MSEGHVPSLLTKDAVCAHLSVSPRCLETMVRDGLFPPPVRIGKAVYWSQAALERWLVESFSHQERWTPRAGGRRKTLRQ
ncbi:helix-turn-helix domain-containing protein [uncultured Aquabacterium sp.]|uniref:helix-turn-helix transcriptional regulator n=1 Tax=uncultured Aquabacterium sp. TaxID=158753 RepID=UPI00262C7DC4|nr:helix-turn-helix domain-containing protein [uncultured Aquabacterium sp.]